MLQGIISGGQTGADRGGLDAAIACGIPHGGWCPKGRKAEDGAIPALYQLKETVSASYPERTRRNVEDADATAILTLGPLTGGSKLTKNIAWEGGKPCLHLSLAVYDDAEAAKWLRWFFTHHGVKVLNIAGSRESREPGIYQRTRECVCLALGWMRPKPVILAGLSGVGKTTLCESLAGQGWAWLEADQPGKDATIELGIKEPWESFWHSHCAGPLAEVLSRRAEAAPARLAVLSLPSGATPTLEHVRAAGDLLRIVCLDASPEHCLASFLARENATGRGFDAEYWRCNNSQLSGRIDALRDAGCVIDAFNPDGSRVAAEALAPQVRLKAMQDPSC